MVYVPFRLVYKKKRRGVFLITVRGKEILLSVAALGIATEAARWAFSARTKRQIVSRATDPEDGIAKSEVSGRYDEPLQAAHINHSRSSGYYDNPDNGVLMTVSEHLIDHIQREGKNGLTKSGNRLAIHLLKEQIVDLYGEEYLQRLIMTRTQPLTKERQWPPTTIQRVASGR